MVCGCFVERRETVLMTPHEIELASALGHCAGWVGSRFMRDIAHAAKTDPTQELTLRQRHYMEIMAWRYRRQIAVHLVPESKPLPMPKRQKVVKVKPAKRIAVPVDNQLPLL